VVAAHDGDRARCSPLTTIASLLARRNTAGGGRREHHLEKLLWATPCSRAKRDWDWPDARHMETRVRLSSGLKRAVGIGTSTDDVTR
jgi:hypothetical protein